MCGSTRIRLTEEEIVRAADTDRRVRRTRELLRRALIELIIEKGYDRTTVQDILDHADVGRSTFYSHYPTKDALLLSGLDQLRAALDPADAISSGDATQSLMAPLRPLFEHAAEHRHLARALLGSRAAPTAVRAGRRMLTETLSAHLRNALPTCDEQQLDMTVAVLVNGLLGLFTWWLDTEPHLPAEQAYTWFDELATHGLQPLLHRTDT